MKVEKILKEEARPFCIVTFTEAEAKAFFRILSSATINEIEKATGLKDGSIEKLMSPENYHKFLCIMREKSND